MEYEVKVTRKGQTTIPAELRRKYNITEGFKIISSVCWTRNSYEAFIENLGFSGLRLQVCDSGRNEKIP
jgi:bifunctional DNA-binding transcriptional regulator/antitoxin component of YhaV-PrlF toxin-antitoxin module